MWLVALGCHRPAPADVVWVDGAIDTMDPSLGVVSALAVSGGRVIYAGDDEGAEALVGPDTRRIALDGATVLPGFTDAHTHLLWSGADLLLVDLYSARTVEAFTRRVVDWAAANPDEPWVQGGGWDLTTFLGSIDRAALDGMVSDRPVYLYSADAHSAVVNSLALSLAGIDASSPDPEDGEIVRDPEGEPTGLLLEGAMELVEAHLPPYSTALVDQGLRDAQREANRYGVTNVVDAMVEPWMLDGYLRADRAGELTVRVHGAAYVDAADPDPAPVIVALRDQYASERLEVNAGKLYLDGVIETGTGVLVDPYVDGTNGAPVFEHQRLIDDVLALDDAGLQLHAHVIGDGAVRQLLDAVQTLVDTNGERDRRPLAAHLELVHPDDLDRFTSLGVLADVQALWAYPDSYVRDLTWPVVGEERSDRLYPFGSLDRAGAVLVGGSDWSVTSQNPFEAIEVMVRRKNPWRDAALVLNQDEAVDLHTAIAAYTSDGARASFSEGELGTLAPGKWADLIVLDRDPYAIPVDELAEVQVTSTWIDGVQVYDAATPSARRVPPSDGRPACPRPRGVSSTGGAR